MLASEVEGYLSQVEEGGEEKNNLEEARGGGGGREVIGAGPSSQIRQNISTSTDRTRHNVIETGGGGGEGTKSEKRRFGSGQVSKLMGNQANERTNGARRMEC